MDQTSSTERLVVASGRGLTFEDGDDRGSIIVSSEATGGAYSVMEWTVAPTVDDQAGFAPHTHGALEETFLIRSGELEFLVGEDVTTVRPGDFIRVPAGVRHGYRNVANEPVDLLVTFVPGGFEELFVRYRTDQKPQIDSRSCVDDAIRDFDSAFE